jgi:uncharacterized membrane protein YbaN (DUF454 family)
MSNLESSEPKRFLYILIGIISLFLGILGIFLPIIPTTPLVLLAAWCFYKSSPRFHNWLVEHPYFGPIVEEYSDGEGIRKESKIKAIILTWLAVLMTALFLLESLFMRVLLIGLALFGTFIILRLKTRVD